MGVFILQTYRAPDETRTTMLCLDSMTMEEAEHALRWQLRYPCPSITFTVCKPMARAGVFYAINDAQQVLEPERAFYTETAWAGFLGRYWPLGKRRF